MCFELEDKIALKVLDSKAFVIVETAAFSGWQDIIPWLDQVNLVDSRRVSLSSLASSDPTLRFVN